MSGRKDVVIPSLVQESSRGHHAWAKADSTRMADGRPEKYERERERERERKRAR